MPTSFILLFENYLGYSRFFAFPYKIENRLFNFYSNACYDSDWDCVESIDQFRDNFLL